MALENHRVIPSSLRAVLVLLLLSVAGVFLFKRFIAQPPPPLTGAKLLAIIGKPLNERRVREVFSALGMDWRAGNPSNHSASAPVEIQVEPIRFARWYQEKGYIKLIRIGSRDRRLPPSQVDSLYPFGITSAMTPPEISDHCARPYAPGHSTRSPGGDIGIEFYEGPYSPMPITVWFKDGKVCGVDIQTWGPE